MILWDVSSSKKHFNGLCGLNQIMYYIGNQMFLAYSICYCFDFYVTLKYPLLPAKIRKAYYHGFAAVIILIGLYPMYTNYSSNFLPIILMLTIISRLMPRVRAPVPLSL